MIYTLLLVFLSGSTGVSSQQLKFSTANECFLMSRKISEDFKTSAAVREVVSYCIPTKE